MQATPFIAGALQPPVGGADEAFIAIKQLSHRYSDSQPPALDRISLRIARGSTFGLLGPNGAGKSTLLSLLTGIATPQSGQISIGGFSLPARAEEMKAISALVPQEYAFYPTLSARENLRFFAGLYRLTADQWRERLAQCVDVCKLQAVLDQPSEQYSGGVKRRLNLAIGLLAAPKVLYLDEPTVGIDAVSRAYILDAIAQLKNTGVTIVYTSHYMEEVEALCDDLAVIDHGRVIVRDRVDKLLSKQAAKVAQITFVEAPTENAKSALARWQPQFADDLHATLIAEVDQLPDILAMLARHGARIDQVQCGVSRLHDVYLRLLEDRL